MASAAFSLAAAALAAGCAVAGSATDTLAETANDGAGAPVGAAAAAADPGAAPQGHCNANGAEDECGCSKSQPGVHTGGQQSGSGAASPPPLAAVELHREDRASDRAAAARLDAHAAWQRRVLDASPVEEHARHDGAGAGGGGGGGDGDAVKFLVFEPRRTGVGNVVEALQSSLLFAVLTRRVFVVDWTPDPGPGASTLPFITEELRDALDPPLAPQHLSADHPNVARHLERAAAAGPVHKVLEPDPMWACDDITSNTHPLSRHRLLVFNTNMYFANLFVPNRHLELAPFLVGRDVIASANPFAPLFRWFVVPEPTLRATVLRAKQMLFERNQSTLGLQMRVSESYGKIEQLPAWWRCVDTAVGATGGADVKIYLATDNPAVQAAAIERFGQRLLMSRALTTVVSRFAARKSPQMVSDALLDIFLLSNCDELLVTGGSSFGRVAFGAADVVPHFFTVESSLWNTRHAPSECVAATTAQPCALRNYRRLLQPKPVPCLDRASAVKVYRACSMT